MNYTVRIDMQRVIAWAVVRDREDNSVFMDGVPVRIEDKVFHCRHCGKEFPGSYERDRRPVYEGVPWYMCKRCERDCIEPVPEKWRTGT